MSSSDDPARALVEVDEIGRERGLELAAAQGEQRRLRLLAVPPPGAWVRRLYSSRAAS